VQEATQEAGIKGTQVRKETSRKEEEENEDDEAECSSGGRTCDIGSASVGTSCARKHAGATGGPVLPATRREGVEGGGNDPADTESAHEDASGREPEGSMAAAVPNDVQDRGRANDDGDDGDGATQCAE